MRRLAALALLILAAATPARDWRQSVGVAPGGGFTVGNPAAGVQLVEYLSFTCPHCAHFAAESKAPLHDGWVRAGVVRVETRSAARDPYDLAAWVVARCAGPRRFAALSAELFARQTEWAGRASDYAMANRDALVKLPQLAQLRALVAHSPLAAIAAKHGLAGKPLAACFATDAQLRPVLAMTDAAFAKIRGTPGFEINGAPAPGADWAALEPQLRAAGAR